MPHLLLILSVPIPSSWPGQPLAYHRRRMQSRAPEDCNFGDVHAAHTASTLAGVSFQPYQSTSPHPLAICVSFCAPLAPQPRPQTQLHHPRTQLPRRGGRSFSRANSHAVATVVCRVRFYTRGRASPAGQVSIFDAKELPVMQRPPRRELHVAELSACLQHVQASYAAAKQAERRARRRRCKEDARKRKRWET